MRITLITLALWFIPQIGNSTISLLLIITSNSELNAHEEAKFALEKLLISAFKDLERTKEKLFNEETNISLNKEQQFNFSENQSVYFYTASLDLRKFIEELVSKGSLAKEELQALNISVKEILLQETAYNRALDDIVFFTKEEFSNCFEFEMIQGAPNSVVSGGNDFEVPITVKVSTSERIATAESFFYTAMTLLGSQSKIVQIEDITNRKIFPLRLNVNGDAEYFYFDEKEAVDKIRSLNEAWIECTKAYFIVTNTYEKYSPGKGTYEDLITSCSPNDLLIGSTQKPISYLQIPCISFPSSNQSIATYYWKDIIHLNDAKSIENYTLRKSPKPQPDLLKSGQNVVVPMFTKEIRTPDTKAYNQNTQGNTPLKDGGNAEAVENGSVNHKGLFNSGGGNGEWALTGRIMTAAPSLDEKPQEEGKVFVDIIVDKNGKVVSATVNEAKSSTSAIGKAKLYELATKAAKSARFSSINDTMHQKGSITLFFKPQ